MTKYLTNKKALKAVMAGVVAFTPVLAVGVNVEKANAAEVMTAETVAESIAAGYEDLNADQRKVFDIVLANLNQHMGNFIQDNVGKDTLTGQMKELVKPFNYTTEENLKVELTTRFNTFTSDAQVQLGESGDAAELLNYIQNVTTQLVEVTGDVTRTNLNSFYDTLFGILNNSLNGVPQGVRDVLQIPNNPVTIISEIQTEVNAAFPTDGGDNTGGSGGGAAPAPTTPPTTTPGAGQVGSGSAAVEANPQSVIDAIKNATTVNELVIELAANAESVNIPVTILNALATKNSNASIVVSSKGSTYSVPVGLMNVTDIATKLGVASAELKMVASLDAVATNPLAGKAGVKVLSNAVDFKLSFVAPDGKSLNLSHFARPVQRSLTADANLNPQTTVGVVVHADGSMSAVPTFVSTDSKSANLYRNSNSVYTLIENSKTFLDVDKGASWAEEYVEKLASRMVVNGVTTNAFKPSQMINRGEFAAILARGLGLVAEDTTTTVFSDVSLNQAFNKNGEIAAVVEAGLVKGFEDKKFHPYDEITRDEAAIMISRAIDYIDSDLVKLDTTKKVSSFKDYKYIGSSARTHVDKVYQAGYLDGYEDNTFRPGAEANRAQMAKILYNFLESIEFIN